MRKYELVLLLEPKTTTAKKKTISEEIKKQIASLKGNLIKEDDWGEKELAYQVGRNSTGKYLYFELEFDPTGAKILSAKLNLESEILRYLFVKKG